jgi:hypothetical protein
MITIVLRVAEDLYEELRMSKAAQAELLQFVNLSHLL